MSPNYFVFCEGDTEVVYVETVYRLIDDLEKLKHEQEKVAHCSAL